MAWERGLKILVMAWERGLTEQLGAAMIHGILQDFYVTLAANKYVEVVYSPRKHLIQTS